MRAATPQALELFREGWQALSRMERRGMCVDLQYLKKARRKTKEKIAELTGDIESDDVFKVWHKMYGAATNLGSKEQLRTVLVEELGYEFGRKTATGKSKVDAEALAKIDIPFVHKYLRIEKLKKARSTYLTGLLREQVDGKVYPVFNLHNVLTFRSSSSNPNFQNQPIRDPEIGKLIRRCYVARKGYRLLEVDFSGAEVCTSACYNKDPQLIAYLKDDHLDMHRDMASQCYMTPLENVSKMMRFWGKSGYVFPVFYGSYYGNCAISLWDAIDKDKLKTVDGQPVKTVLRKNGIRSLGDVKQMREPKPGTFIHHIKAVEEDFWGRRFRVYDQWKKDWWAKYLKDGGFMTLTGFWLDGVMEKNDAVNYPIQGSAFHCLLWTLIEVDKRLRKLKMKTKLIGQVHDSIVADVPESETSDYLDIVKEVACSDLARHFREWMIVPMEIEAEITPLGGSWYDKKEIAI